MNKIEANAKFRELLKEFNEAPKVATKDPKVAAVGRRKEQENNANPDLVDVPLSVRKPKRQLKAPGRYDASPVPRPKPKQVSPKLRANLLVRQNQNASPRIARKPAGPASPPGRIARHPNPDLQMRQANQTDIVQPSEDSDDNISESASAVQSPPRGSAFSRVVPTHKKQPSPHEPWNDSQFVQPPARASRDPRIRNTNLNQIPMQPQSQYDNIASTSRSSNNLRRRPAQKPETSLRQPQLFQSSMRHIVREQSMSHSNREPYVRLTDCQPRGGALHLGDGFQRPQTPPEVRDMASIAKSALREAINKLIDCPHVNALECIYIINSTQDAVVAMIDKLRRRRERTESILRSDSLMKTQDINTSNHRVHAWLDTVDSSRIGGNQESHYRTTSVPKRQKLDSQYVYSRLNQY